MKVLLIGSGGREHALAWKLAESPRVTQLFVAPGNAGTAQVADNVVLDPFAFADVEKFVRKNGVEAFLNGKSVSKWTTDFSDAEPAGFWALKNRKRLGVGAGSTKVTLLAVEVREVTGRGVQQ